MRVCGDSRDGGGGEYKLDARKECDTLAVIVLYFILSELTLLKVTQLLEYANGNHTKFRTLLSNI